MRISLLLSALALNLPLWGCGVECGSPNQANGVYTVFANPITYQVTNDEAFPSYMTPANGWSEWELVWNTLSTGEVAVKIDGQPYAGRGSWDDIECGNFHLAFEGSYTSVNESTHLFEIDGQFVLFGPQIEGEFDWAESWTSKHGDTGTFTSQGQLQGQRIGKADDS